MRYQYRVAVQPNERKLNTCKSAEADEVSQQLGSTSPSLQPVDSQFEYIFRPIYTCQLLRVSWANTPQFLPSSVRLQLRIIFLSLESTRVLRGSFDGRMEWVESLQWNENHRKAYHFDNFIWICNLSTTLSLRNPFKLTFLVEFFIYLFKNFHRYDHIGWYPSQSNFRMCVASTRDVEIPLDCIRHLK